MIFEVGGGQRLTVRVREISEHPVFGYLHEPESEAIAGLVLTHGAGGNCGSALLVNVAAALASFGWAVLRCDLPFRQKRRFGPPSPAHAEADREGLHAAVGQLRSRIAGRVFLGGHSYGGRQASILAAEQPTEIPGLLLLSYPLHPPRKPEQLRTAHFSRLQSPCLFVQGTRDAFASPEEMATAIELIPAKRELVVLDGLGHDLGGGRTGPITRTVEKFTEFISGES
jgi:predicted alpha/beta-hydrolase family hydrolase